MLGAISMAREFLGKILGCRRDTSATPSWHARGRRRRFCRGAGRYRFCANVPGQPERDEIAGCPRATPRRTRPANYRKPRLVILSPDFPRASPGQNATPAPLTLMGGACGLREAADATIASRAISARDDDAADSILLRFRQASCAPPKTTASISAIASTGECHAGGHRAARSRNSSRVRPLANGADRTRRRRALGNNDSAEGKSLLPGHYTRLLAAFIKHD